MAQDSWANFMPFDLPGDLDEPGDIAKDKEAGTWFFEATRCFSIFGYPRIWRLSFKPTPKRGSAKKTNQMACDGLEWHFLAGIGTLWWLI